MLQLSRKTDERRKEIRNFTKRKFTSLTYIIYVCVLKIEFEIACLCLQFSAGKSDVP